MGSGSCSWLPRLFCCRALAVVGLVCLLVLASLGSVRGTRNPTTLSSTWPSQATLKHEHVIGSGDIDHRPVNQAELDFNYMSKRRVPNGPDPIHNRFVYLISTHTFRRSLCLLFLDKILQSDVSSGFCLCIYDFTLRDTVTICYFS